VDNWNHSIQNLPCAHILQTEEWAKVKRMNGWSAIKKTWNDQNGQLEASSMILQRSIPVLGFAAKMRILYIPRGPMLNWENTSLRQRIFADLEKYSREQGAIFIKMDPEVIVGRGMPGTVEASEDIIGNIILKELHQRGWRFSPEQIQFRNTVWLDLSGDEETWLARMKQKTRYNIHLAQRKGVVIRSGSVQDLHTLYTMYLETSVRDGFVIRSEEYYASLWKTFIQANLAKVLVAEVEGESVGGMVLFHFAGKAWYMFGMSNQKHKEKMPNYLLQWEAMRLAKSLGCWRYDLWGAPDEFMESDSMWNVFRFKEGLGGQVIRTMGAWDYPPHPWLYRLYTKTLRHILDVMRRAGKAKAKRLVG